MVKPSNLNNLYTLMRGKTFHPTDALHLLILCLVAVLR